ncbi:MAG TPA: hypothetical protein VGM01_09275 [Ktedonobacteraceae bacterium]
MNNLDLPPFPALGTSGPQVCEAVRSYLAIVDELPFEQVRILSEHVKGCPECAAEFRLLQKTTRMLANLPVSTPSARVDDAILAFLHSQQPANHTSVQLHPEKRISQQQQATSQRQRLSAKKRTSSSRRLATLALVAALLVVLVGAGMFLRGLIWPASTQAFTLPANLSWSGYVLHYTQTKIDARGKPYEVEVYQDLGTNQMHIESMMQGTFDVVVVTDQANMLGKDMMHHVAQEGNGVANWAIDGSAFDLAQLRQDLADQRATYLGQSTFANQQVYQIRTSNNQILLLNTHYFPVNVLSTSSQTSTNAPVYSACVLMHSAQVSDSMWDMQVPANFRMGKLPTKS